MFVCCGVATCRFPFLLSNFWFDFCHLEWMNFSCCVQRLSSFVCVGQKAQASPQIQNKFIPFTLFFQCSCMINGSRIYRVQTLTSLSSVLHFSCSSLLCSCMSLIFSCKPCSCPICLSSFAVCLRSDELFKSNSSSDFSFSRIFNSSLQMDFSITNFIKRKGHVKVGFVCTGYVWHWQLLSFDWRTFAFWSNFSCVPCTNGSPFPWSAAVASAEWAQSRQSLQNHPRPPAQPLQLLDDSSWLFTLKRLTAWSDRWITTSEQRFRL